MYARERAKDVEIEQEEPEVEVEEEEQARLDEQYVDGDVPDVEDSAIEAEPTASQLAFEDEDNVRELKAKIGELIAKRFDGDAKRAFEHFDRDQDNQIDQEELISIMAEAGVGSAQTRAQWAARLIERLDRDGEIALEQSEFTGAFGGSDSAAS